MGHTRSAVQRVVVATDFSENATVATEWGAHIAREHGASLTLLHALRPPLPAAQAAEEGALEVRRSAAREEIEEVGRQLASSGLDVAIEIVESAAADALAESKVRADVVVAGASSTTGPLGFLHGSTAAGIVQKCECPVLTVRRGAAPSPLRRILAPVDFSGHSLLAVETAAALSEGVESAELVLTHVFQPPAGLYRFGKTEELPLAIAEDRRKREDRLDELAAEFRGLGYAVAAAVRMGDPATEILEEARTRRPDAIAMGTHGRGALGRLLLGSTTREVLSSAPCPVLTVRRIDEE